MKILRAIIIIEIFLKFFIYNLSADDFNESVYKARRDAVLSKLSDKSALIILSDDYFDIKPKNYKDICFNTNLVYLTGIKSSHTALVLYPMGINNSNPDEKNKSCLFGLNNDKYIFDKIFDINLLPDYLFKISQNIDTLYISELPKLTEEVNPEDLVNHINIIKDLKTKLPQLYIKIGYNGLKLMRELKTDEEIEKIKKAVEISISGHLEAMKNLKSSRMESDLQSAFEKTTLKNKNTRLAYPSIVASGNNLMEIHYYYNQDSLKNLVIMDCGVEWEDYCSDITRTLPINGKFSNEQLELYNLVLEAQDTAISYCRVGKMFMTPHIKAVDVLKRGLTQLGILKEPQQYRKYITHGVTHYLGMDVHDVGTSGSLKAGDVFAVEPGVYIPVGSDCDPKWWGIGIRIEDDVLVTTNDPVILSEKFPRKAKDIENLIK